MLAKIVEKKEGLKMTEKFNQERYENFRENFLDDIAMPEGFIDSAWHDDVFPSIEHESNRIHIFFADIDGFLSDYGQIPEGWKKYMFQSHPTEIVYAEEYALAGDPDYVKFETNDWNEILEKIEAWKKTQTELNLSDDEICINCEKPLNPQNGLCDDCNVN